MKRIRSPLILLCLLAGMLLAGCALLPAGPQPATDTPQPPRATLPLLPSPTPVPPTSTPQTVLPACIPELRDVDLAADSYDAYPQAVLDYLNAGGSPVALADQLNQAGVGAQPVSAVVADFTGDGFDDVAVALYDPTEMGLPSNGRLVIYVCNLAAYQIGLNIRADQEYFQGFHIWFWQDLDAAGGAELLVSQGLCGAHTCFDDLQVLSWDGAVFIDRFEGSTAEIPYPQFSVSDEDGDGIYQIEAASAGFGSVGAGPQRPATWIWRLKTPGNTWVLDEERSDPSPYRIHVLHDADDAAAIGDYDLARQLYQRVIDDDSLDNWIVEDGGEALRAYARYRLAVIAVILGDRPAADQAITQMDTLYPQGTDLHDYVEMAILFRNAFAGGGLESACTGAAGFAESHAATVLQPLGSQVYGYANRDYTGESMCPAALTPP